MPNPSRCVHYFPRRIRRMILPSMYPVSKRSGASDARDDDPRSIDAENVWKIRTTKGPPRAVTNGRVPNTRTRSVYGDEDFVSSQFRDRQMWRVRAAGRPKRSIAAALIMGGAEDFRGFGGVFVAIGNSQVAFVVPARGCVLGIRASRLRRISYRVWTDFAEHRSHSENNKTMSAVRQCLDTLSGSSGSRPQLARTSCRTHFIDLPLPAS